MIRRSRRVAVERQFASKEGVGQADSQAATKGCVGRQCANTPCTLSLCLAPQCVQGTREGSSRQYVA